LVDLRWAACSGSRSPGAAAGRAISASSCAGPPSCRGRLAQAPSSPRATETSARASTTRRATPAAHGNVGWSIYYALGVTAAFALGLTPFALILAGFIFVTTALNYAEGTAALPHAGGSSSFARRAFNEPIGFLAGWVPLSN